LSTPWRAATWYKLGGGVAAVLALLLVYVGTTGGADGHHPMPRPEVAHASHVLAAERYEAYPRIEQVYSLVAAVPMIVDGIYCYCRCVEHSGHYSLLDCFASDHAAGCDVCLSEAAMAHQMTQDGNDLKAIRAAIDARYRS
jgi:hypothetical protein